MSNVGRYKGWKFKLEAATEYYRVGTFSRDEDFFGTDDWESIVYGSTFAECVEEAKRMIDHREEERQAFLEEEWFHWDGVW